MKSNVNKKQTTNSKAVCKNRTGAEGSFRALPWYMGMGFSFGSEASTRPPPKGGKEENKKRPKPLKAWVSVYWTSFS